MMFYIINYQYRIPKESILDTILSYKSLYNSFESFPGDANRGFEIPPITAIFTIESSSSFISKTNSTNQYDPCHNWIIQQQQSETTNNEKQYPIDTTLYSFTLYSNPLLVLVPLPDMSMPYNVLSITCTFYAFVIGSIFNLVIKKANESVKYKLDPSLKPPNKLKQLKDRVRNKLQHVKQKIFTQRKRGDTTGSSEQRIKAD